MGTGFCAFVLPWYASREFGIRRPFSECSTSYRRAFYEIEGVRVEGWKGAAKVGSQGIETGPVTVSSCDEHAPTGATSRRSGQGKPQRRAALRRPAENRLWADHPARGTGLLPGRPQGAPGVKCTTVHTGKHAPCLHFHGCSAGFARY